jgi:hypothetical protein
VELQLFWRWHCARLATVFQKLRNRGEDEKLVGAKVELATGVQDADIGNDPSNGDLLRSWGGGGRFLLDVPFSLRKTR